MASASVKKETSASLVLLMTINVVLKESGTDICFRTLFSQENEKVRPSVLDPPQTGAHVYLSAAYLSPKRKKREKNRQLPVYLTVFLRRSEPVCWGDEADEVGGGKF